MNSKQMKIVAMEASTYHGCVTCHEPDDPKDAFCDGARFGHHLAKEELAWQPIDAIDTMRFWLRCKIAENKTPDTSSCIEWQGTLTRGYGRFKLDSKTHQAHRISWLIHHKEMPDLMVLHKCDNRKCVNPHHLFLGTAKTNYDDARAKGRAYVGGTTNPQFGEDNPASKLTKEAVQEIRLAIQSGSTISAIARVFNVSRGTVRNIRDKKNWKEPPTQRVAEVTSEGIE